MLTEEEIRSIGMGVRKSYNDPPIDRCYDVCCDMADTLVDSYGLEEGKSFRVVPLYLKDTSIKHYIVEMSSSCVEFESTILVDPTIDQFSELEESKGSVPISLGSDLPKVGIYLCSEHPY